MVSEARGSRVDAGSDSLAWDPVSVAAAKASGMLNYGEGLPQQPQQESAKDSDLRLGSSLGVTLHDCVRPLATLSLGFFICSREGWFSSPLNTY